jgi:hypothetical protein
MRTSYRALPTFKYLKLLARDYFQDLFDRSAQSWISGSAEGKTKTEIMRCLKRYIAREVFPLLVT